MNSTPIKNLQALKIRQIKQLKLRFVKICVGIWLKLKLINKMIMKNYISSTIETTHKNNSYVKPIINIVFEYICFNSVIISIQSTIRTTIKQ